MNLDVRAVLEIGGLIFAAGGFYVMGRATRHQVNGVGRKLGKVILYLEETAEGQERERLTDILKD
jgi:hypothetical protein